MVVAMRRSIPLAALVLSAGALSAGCGVVPKSQLDECRQRGQALRAENDRLKDQVLTLRSENQEIAERSVDDERRLKAQDDAIARLEESARAYQDDRERLAASYDRLKEQIQASAGPEAAVGSSDGLMRFAHEHPGASFDAASGVLTLPVETLFNTGAAKLRPEADTLLSNLAAALSSPDTRQRAIVLSVAPDDEAVRRVGADDEPARVRFLAMARANQVRERLAARGNVDPSRIRLADPERAQSEPVAARGTPSATATPLEIRLAHAAEAPASGP